MITINNSIEYLTVSINEAYKENNENWDKVLIIRFPKAEFSFDEAVNIIEGTKTITTITKDKITKYYITEIIDKKENEYYTEIWANNPKITVTDNFTAEKIAQDMLEEQINKAIQEGVNSIDN